MASRVVRRRRHWWQTLAGQEAIAGYVAISPWIVGFLVFQAGMMAYALYLSFTEYNIMNPPKFIGFGNYEKMFFRDDLFGQALKVTTIYSIVVVPLGVTIAYALAILLNQKVVGLSFWRTFFYMPVVVPAIAASYIFAWMFAPNFGLINGLLSTIGIEGPGWFASVEWALPSFVILSTWGAGGGLILFLAALQGVPTDLYDAAKVDGANPWRRFWAVTAPMTSPILLFSFILGIIGSFQNFIGAFLITAGGPVNATLFIVLYLYQIGWKELNMGYAAGLAWILFIIILALTIITLVTSRRLVYYAATD